MNYIQNLKIGPKLGSAEILWKSRKNFSLAIK